MLRYIRIKFYKIEVVPNVYAYVNFETKSGHVDLYSPEGVYGLAEYKISSTPNDEYIIFALVNKRLFTFNFDTTAFSGSYWKDEVFRTYPLGSFETSILYSEFGPYGYASGTLSWYAAGINRYSPEYNDIWYEGTLYYGSITPSKIENIE